MCASPRQGGLRWWSGRVSKLLPCSPAEAWGLGTPGDRSPPLPGAEKIPQRSRTRSRPIRTIKKKRAYMASVGIFRRPNTLPVHPLASPCTPGHRGIAGDGSGSPRRVRSLCGLGARRPGRAIRPREADTQTRPGRSWPRLRGVDARAPLRAHSRPRGAGRSGARPPRPAMPRPALRVQLRVPLHRNCHFRQ